MWQCSDTLECIYYELTLMRCYSIISSDTLDIFECCEKRYGSRDVRCPWFIAIWQSCCFISYLCDRVDSATSGESWLHLLKERFLRIEDPDTSIRHHLVSCSDIGIDIESYDIETEVRE